ncbi:MAG: PilZ domain-containing protein [Rhodanobacter sp.]
MSADNWDDFEQRVSCEESLHVDSEPLVWPPSTARQLRMIERNVTALTAVAALEERPLESVDEDNPVMQEMLRMDAKLTALVDIVNQLLVPAAVLPPRQLVRFNVVGALLPGLLAPNDDAIILRPRFDACPGLSLELAARVERRFADGRVFVAFALLGEALSDAIGRLVFRHHRRKVAEARQLAG